MFLSILQVFQTYVSSVSSAFFYVVSVASKYFKSISDICTWDACGKRDKARAIAARATIDGTGPRVAVRDAGVGEQCSGDAGPCVEVRKQTAVVGVWMRASICMFGH